MRSENGTRKSERTDEAEDGGELSTVRPGVRPLAVLTSDWHLSHRPPIARSAEPDWYAVQERYINELFKVSHSYSHIPIIIAGDVFDRWDSPAELINFAIRTLGKGESIFTIPGQHDLPNHRYDELKRSAYWTLVIAEAIINLEPQKSHRMSTDYTITSCPWGVDIPQATKSDTKIQLAVVHGYCWYKEQSYPGAPEDKHIHMRAAELLDKGYNAAVFGDNHKGFIFRDRRNGIQVINSGTLMRRTISERDYKPMVGLLMSDGEIKTHYLDCSEDKFVEATEEEFGSLGSGIDIEQFKEALDKSVDLETNFDHVLQAFFSDNKVKRPVRNIIRNALHEATKK